MSMEKVSEKSIRSISVDQDFYQDILDGRTPHMLLPAEDLIRMMRLEKIAPTSREDLAVDFGCGEGRNTEFLLNFGYKVLATDVSEVALRATEARSQVRGAQFSLLDPLGSKLPAVDNTVSLIVCWEVLHWLGSKEAFVFYLREFKRIMKKVGSTVIFTMPTEQHYVRLRSIEIGQSQFLSTSKARQDCVLYSPNLETLKNLLRVEGFEIRRLSSYSRGDAVDKDMTLTTTFSMYVFACS